MGNALENFMVNKWVNKCYVFVELKYSSPCSMQPFIDPISEPFLSAIQVLVSYFYTVDLKNIIMLNSRSSCLRIFGKIF